MIASPWPRTAPSRSAAAQRAAEARADGQPVGGPSAGLDDVQVGLTGTIVDRGDAPDGVSVDDLLTLPSRERDAEGGAVAFQQAAVEAKRWLVTLWVVAKR